MKPRREAPRVALDSVGCKLNQAEMEHMAWELAGVGYRLVGPEDEADIYVLNTCTVTGVADRKSRHLLRQARRRNPKARLVAVGCYAERAPGELEKIEGVDLVLGNARKMGLVSLLGEIDKIGGPDLAGLRLHARRTRSFINVQDGCQNFCAYCIVPLVRRREESVPVEQVVAGVRARQAAGYLEVVLTGTEVGTYRSDGINLGGLLERLLAETDIPRLRLSSLQPQEITPGLLGLWRDSRLCPHFHLSLQSGSDGVLRRMKRRYSAADYLGAVSLIRESVPEVSITTDVIAGFPGETGMEFRESYDLCRQVKFARIHVFPYSPRPGTEAALMTPIVNDKIKRQRTRAMLALAGESLQDYNRLFAGRIVEVLWEQKAGGIWSGLTGNYIRVYARSRRELTNKLLPAKLAEVFRDGMRGEVL